MSDIDEDEDNSDESDYGDEDDELDNVFTITHFNLYILEWKLHCIRG
jgi:hypothetical protein